MTGNYLVVQWLGYHALTAEGSGSISGRGTKIPQGEWRGQTSLPPTEKKSPPNIMIIESTQEDRTTVIDICTQHRSNIKANVNRHKEP